MKDKEHLQWIHDRIVEVYGESRNVDFLHRMRKIIDNQDTNLTQSVVDRLFEQREAIEGIIKQLSPQALIEYELKKLEKEPEDYYLNTRVYERCYFCNSETEHWHLESNTPVCKKCAPIHDVKDIKK